MFSFELIFILQAGCRVCWCSSKNETEHKAQIASGNSTQVSRFIIRFSFSLKTMLVVSIGIIIIIVYHFPVYKSAPFVYRKDFLCHYT